VRPRLVAGVLVALAAITFVHVGPARADCARQLYRCGDMLAQVGSAPATTTDAEQPILPSSNEDDSPPYVMIALTTVLVAGGCLYLLFRRGSIAYRARQEDEHGTGGPTVQ
jgi:hypothetical protein